jgi:aminomethyltransferase
MLERLSPRGTIVIFRFSGITGLSGIIGKSGAASWRKKDGRLRTAAESQRLCRRLVSGCPNNDSSKDLTRPDKRSILGYNERRESGTITNFFGAIMEKKTSLYDCHVAGGGKMVAFAGYLLPIQYEATGVIKEHTATRTQIGMFDVSHMGEITFKGEDALKNLNALLTNDFTNMAVGQARYSLMPYETGGIVDDLIVYKRTEYDYMIVVNASTREKDVAWMKQHLFGSVEFSDVSDEISQIALQGPKSKDLIAKLCREDDIPQKYYTANFEAKIANVPCTLSRTGYTGEFGYEIYCENGLAMPLWNIFLDAGKEFGITPCGLGARDTLRLEASMPLYGHEMDETINPLEADLGFAVKLTKDDFIGKKALLEQIEPKRKRVGIKMIDKGIAREHQDVYLGGNLVGKTTSGTHCPTLGGAYAMALLDKNATEVGTRVEIDVRGRKIAGEIVPLPFYKRS